MVRGTQSIEHVNEGIREREREREIEREETWWEREREKI